MKTLSQKATILWAMTRCDFKLRDQGTFLGFLWTLLNPLLMFAVLYLVFSAWFEKLVEHYPVYLLLGVIHWNFFSLATSNAVAIFERKRHFLKSFALRGPLIPLTAVLTVFISYLVESFIVIGLCAFTVGVSLSGVAWFLVLLLLHLLLVMGISLLLANAYIFFRDTSHLWGIALRIGFFLTPVFYPLNVIDHRKLLVLKLNPLFHLFDLSRQAIIEGTIPLSGAFFYVVGFSLVLLLGAAKLYTANQEKLVERL